MNADSFEVIKKNLEEFDQSIIENWKSQFEIAEKLDGPSSSDVVKYLAEIPDFPLDGKALVQQEGEMNLSDIALSADPGEDVDMEITLDTMRKKFAFSATPVERPMFIPAKKRSKKRKKEGRHRPPGRGTPRSESTTFGPKKK